MMEAYSDEFAKAAAIVDGPHYFMDTEIGPRWQEWVGGCIFSNYPPFVFVDPGHTHPLSPGDNERVLRLRVADLEAEKAAQDRLIAQLTDAMKMRSEPGVFSRPKDNGPLKSLPPNFRSQPDRYYPARLATSGETI